MSEDIKPFDFSESDEIICAGRTLDNICKRTEELALPVIQQLAEQKIDLEEAFSQLKQIFLDNFSSTAPIVAGDRINTSPRNEFRNNLTLLLFKNKISVADTETLLKKLFDPEDIRDKVEKVVEKD